MIGDGARDLVVRHGALVCLVLMFMAMLPLALIDRPGWASIATAALAVPLAMLSAARLDRARRNHRRVNRIAAVTTIPVSIAETIDAELAREPGGIVGIVDFVDFPRMAAFDPEFAERVLDALTDRIGRMIGPRRPCGPAGRARTAIWFGTVADIADARAEMEAIRYALAGAIEVDDQPVMPDLRVVCTAAQPGETAALLLARATAIIASGTIAQPSDDSARRAFTLEQDLRCAIDRNELHLQYQPLVDGARNCVVGAEALLRWHHPQHGLIPPADFIPTAESAGLIEEIGLWTLNAAAREARGWTALNAGPLHVAVNLSAQQLTRGDLVLSVERTLARQRFAPQALELELTETATATDAGHTRALFQRLRAIGVRIAIDDFGTGYSSLSTLRTLAFDKIKIDREFVTEVDTRRDSQAICQSVIALARGLGIRVLAEGVERREEFEWLRRHGCALFQGYYFARPLDAADFAAFVGDRATLTRLSTLSPGARQHRIAERFSA